MKRVISQNLERIEGKEAWNANLDLTKLVARVLGSSLGPKGAFKLISYNRGPEQVAKVTKDAASIVEELGIYYPAIRIASEAAKLHREEAGEGVSSCLLIMANLVINARELSNKGIHTNLILHGYNLALNRVLQTINEKARAGGVESLPSVLRVLDCGRGLLVDTLIKEMIEAYQRASRDGGFDKKRVRILTRLGGSVVDSKLVRGIVIKKGKTHPNMPDRLRDLRIVLTTQHVGIKHLETLMKGEGRFPVRIEIEEPSKISKFKEEEQRMRARLIEKLLFERANVLVSGQKIDEQLIGMLQRQGIFAMMSVDQQDLDALAEATGAHLLGELKEIHHEDVGKAAGLEVDRYEPEEVVTFTDCGGFTLLLRANTPEVMAELERAVKSALSVLEVARKDGRTVFGGGAIEMELSKELREYSLSFPGKEQLAIQAFAGALDEIPTSLARNFGLNPLDIMIELSERHANGNATVGVTENGCRDVTRLGLRELAYNKKLAINRAYEVATLMLRIDEIFTPKAFPKFHKQ